MAQTDWVVYRSPLWHKDTVQDQVKELPGKKERITLEHNFVNDAIRTTVFHYPRKKPIIPIYSARKDKCAQSYFQSPLVKSLMQKERLSHDEAAQSASVPVSCTPRGTQTARAVSNTPSQADHNKFVGSPYKNREMKAREMLKEEKNINKLSHRNRVQRTPSVQDIRARESKFTNDAVVTERRRTRFKDIIPQYDASLDRHCKAYFKRRDVQQLITVTRSREENKMEKYWDRKLTIAKQYTMFGVKENGKVNVLNTCMLHAWEDSSYSTNYPRRKCDPRSDTNRNNTKTNPRSNPFLKKMTEENRTKSAKRHNKLYRAPPTPPPTELMKEERGFVLDCNAVSSISSDFSKANPKLGPVIPPYNSQKDGHVSNYFKFQGVDRTLEKTGQGFPGTSIDGHVMDYFEAKGPGYQYVNLRNEAGAGYSSELRDGHAQFMQGIKPAMGYNGQYGFRRNTPWLRQSPSPFGTASRSPAHEITVVPRASGKTVQAK